MVSRPYLQRVFPVIVILIALSLLGLMYFQISWIRNAALVEQTKYKNQLDNAMIDVRKQLLNRAIEVYGYDPAYANTDEDAQSIFWQNLQFISPAEINNIIKTQLDKNAIDLDFEYAIMNPMDYVISRSSGFTREKIEEAAHINLNYNGSNILYIYVKATNSYIWGRLWWMIVASVLFSIIIVTAFALTVGTIFRQRKLSEIKTDFINNMTHEFKTPLATISLAVGAINNKKVQDDPEKLSYYTKIINDENKRMNKQVESILQAAKMESNTLELNLQRVDVHEQITKAANNISLSINELNGAIYLYLHATNHQLMLDEVHFSNLINNLLDNAVKYTNTVPKIHIESFNPSSDKLIIKIKDNGVGMSKETQSHIFEKFYRAHTGNLHNVKGFGLGLSYVKTVVDAHKGKIKVESAPGKGSSFILEFPVPKNM